MALILVLVVLLVLTMLAISSSDTSNLQSIMARNSQLRMEAFNASNVEIEAQIDSYLAGGDTPKEVLKLINQGVGSKEKSSSTGTDIVIRSNDSEVLKLLELEYVGGCPTTTKPGSAGQQLNEGTPNVLSCIKVLLSSDAQLLSPEKDSSGQRIPLNIKSNQKQTLKFEVLE